MSLDLEVNHDFASMMNNAAPSACWLPSHAREGPDHPMTASS